ncbi:hypothetical protein HDC92_004348 [Pedobacter sp. AK017]|uniref:hypothetical protein n=1 Tax=Pedobacter sp. AK017 TaxID=2723073 RepID=UPI00161A3C5A|nr:hypothetical protein [Pedobacter sp. AK017]MBB5440645.1 hypothetical protein [Pedobacter sp. AK017]
MNFRGILILALLAGQAGLCPAQKKIRDKHITNQQERMVFKQWDRNKFTPTSGFLGLNPDYWITWFLHPNYPKTDLRPLGPYGPQTQRLGLALAMQQTAGAYKLHADTLAGTALIEMVNYSAAFSSIDPLWLLYYKSEFVPLLQAEMHDPLEGMVPNVRAYLYNSGLAAWYGEQSDLLRDRLLGAMQTNADRGSRIINYHRLLADYRKLQASWESKKQHAAHYLGLLESLSKIRTGETVIPQSSSYRSDKQIADAILRNSKL